MTRSLGIRKARVNGTIKVHKERENASCLVFSIFILTLSRIKISADIFYFFLFFYFYFFFFFTFCRKMNLTFHTNCLLRRQFAWNVRSIFLEKIRKNKNIINLSSAEFIHSVLSKFPMRTFQNGV